MKKRSILSLIALPAFALAVASCDSPQEEAVEDAAEQRADALEERADAVRDQDNTGALGTTGEAAEERADALEERADEVRDAAD